MKTTRIQIISNIAFLLPGIFLAVKFFSGSLSANPIQSATILTGRTAIYALLISLFCSPLSRILKMSVFHRIRKVAGLYGFYYALSHFLIFYILDFRGNLTWIIPEFQQKPFLIVGLIALFLLIPLTVTSFKGLKIKMGKLWKWLHYIVYLITALVLLHATIASKGDIVDPAILISLFIIAMLFRIPPLRVVHIRSLPQNFQELNTYLIS